MNREESTELVYQAEIKQLVLALRSLILAGTNAQERVAIHHAKILLSKYEDIR